MHRRLLSVLIIAPVLFIALNAAGSGSALAPDFSFHAMFMCSRSNGAGTTPSAA